MSNLRPTVVDLCCGPKGGWAKGFVEAGWDVLGIDIVECPNYPGRFLLRDVRTWEPIFNVDAVVASPPCQEFARHSMPWTRAKNPPQPDLSIVEACYRLKESLKPRFFLLENVRGAQPFIGQAPLHRGPYYFWGDVALVPELKVWSHKESMSSTNQDGRAEIPFTLSYGLANLWKATL